MDSVAELAEELSEYGITCNQAKVYISAAKLGIASASQISKESAVPREEVYRLLPKLEKLGLIEKTVERPMKIKATDFRFVLSTLVRYKKENDLRRISELEARRENIVERFRSLKLQSKSEDKAHFTMIMQKDAINEKIVTMIEKAKKIIRLSVSRDHFIHLGIRDCLPIQKALSRNIEFRIILEKSEFDEVIEESIKQLQNFGRVAVRFVDQQQSHYLLVDSKEALISTSMTCSSHSGNLWTDDFNLVKLIVENFKVMWLTSWDMKAVKMENEEEKLRCYLKTLQPTDHLLFIYRSLESKYNVLCNFLKLGLEKGEVVVCVCSEDNPSQVRDQLRKFGVVVEKNEAAGALKIVGYDDFYIINGKFSIDSTMGLLRQMYDDAVEMGFKGCRVFGEMSCFFQYDLKKELIEYEKAVHRILDIPIVGMCAYNADIFDKCDSPEEEYIKLLKTHANILFTGQDKHLEKFEIR